MKLARWLLFGSCLVACQRKTAPVANDLRSSVATAAAPSSSVAAVANPVVDAAVEQAPRPALREGCEDAVAELVNALPQVKRELASAQREADRSHGQERFGGIGPNDNDDGGFTAMIGLHTDERFEPRVSYNVDGKGTLHVNCGGGDLELSVAIQSAARRACAP